MNLKVSLLFHRGNGYETGKVVDLREPQHHLPYVVMTQKPDQLVEITGLRFFELNLPNLE
jgi:hypothetical protein